MKLTTFILILMNPHLTLHIDSNAVLSIISRTGFDKAKHIKIQYLWHREAIRNNGLMVEKIPSEPHKIFLVGHKESHKRKVGNVDETRELLCTCEALDTCADDQPRAHWPRLRGVTRISHVHQLAWCPKSHPVGRKMRWPVVAPDCLQPRK